MKKQELNFVVYIEQDDDGIYIGTIPTIPNCYAQGETKEEMLNNLTEVIKLCIRNIPEETFSNSHFIETQNLNLTYA